MKQSPYFPFCISAHITWMNYIPRFLTKTSSMIFRLRHTFSKIFRALFSIEIPTCKLFLWIMHQNHFIFWADVSGIKMLIVCMNAVCWGLGFKLRITRIWNSYPKYFKRVPKAITTPKTVLVIFVCDKILYNWWMPPSFNFSSVAVDTK